MKYNIRDNKTGRFAKMIAVRPKIVPNRLYDWKGTTVRAIHVVGDTATVMVHKTLFGIVATKELSLIDKQRVETYLNNA